MASRRAGREWAPVQKQHRLVSHSDGVTRPLDHLTIAELVTTLVPEHHRAQVCSCQSLWFDTLGAILDS